MVWVRVVDSNALGGLHHHDVQSEHFKAGGKERERAREREGRTRWSTAVTEKRTLEIRPAPTLNSNRLSAAQKQSRMRLWPWDPPATN